MVSKIQGEESLRKELYQINVVEGQPRYRTKVRRRFGCSCALELYGFIINRVSRIVNYQISFYEFLYILLFSYIYKSNCAKRTQKVMQMDIVDRIFALVDKQYPEQKDFASRIGVVPSVVSSWRKKKSTSYNKRLPEIAEALGTTLEYLLTEQKPSPDPIGDPEIAEALSVFGKLTPEERTKVIGYMEGLISQHS